MIAAIGLIGMLLLELIAMRVEGVRSYFSQVWNYFDMSIVPVFIAFFVLRIRPYDVNDTDSDHIQWLILLNSFILLYIAVKLVYFMKV